jgi:hypothetical protein
VKRVFEIEWDGKPAYDEWIRDRIRAESVTELDLDAIKRRARLEGLREVVRFNVTVWDVVQKMIAAAEKVEKK